MNSEQQIFCLGIFRLQEIICECNCTNVFHCSNSKFWTKDLIILLPWVFDTSIFFIEFDSFINYSEKLLPINVIFLAISQIYFHRHHSIFIFILNHVKLSSAHVVNIAGDGWALFKFMKPIFLWTIFFFINQILKLWNIRFLDARSCSIGNDFPFFRRTQDLKVKWCTDTWLIKTREPSMAEERLTMWIDVCSLIFRINIFVEPGTVIDKSIFKGKFYLIQSITIQQLIISNSNSMV